MTAVRPSKMLVYIIIGSRYSMMNIALGAVQECGTHLQWVQWDKAYADLLNRVREGLHRRMMKS